MKNIEVKDCGSSLAKLKKMTESLITRDHSHVQDTNLFEHFLENCPLKIYLWVLDKELNIIHPTPGSLGAPQEFFQCAFKEDLFKNHQEFLSSSLELKHCIIGNEEEIYLVTIKKDGELLSGSALEITTRIKMLHLLFKIIDESKDCNESLVSAIQGIISNDSFSLSILKLLEAWDDPESHQSQLVTL